MRLFRALVAGLPLIALLHCGGSSVESKPEDTPDGSTDSARPKEEAGKTDDPRIDATSPDSARDGEVTLDAADAADAAVRYVPKFYSVNHVLSTGQSLSVGSGGTPVLSTSQPFDNRMLDTGVRTGAVPATSFVLLVETGVETMSSALANLAADYARTEVLLGLPAPNDGHRILVSCHGRGGTAYVGLKKGTAPYAAGIAQVTAAKAIADGSSESYIVRVLTNVHGESDHIAMNASYAQNLAEWQSDYETDVKAITGQTDPIPMLHTQMASWTKYGQATSDIPIQQLAASVASNGKIVMVGPKYNVEYVADGVHLTSAGYRHMGEYYAKVYRRIVLEGKKWEPLRPVAVTRAADEIRIKFLVPVPPLALDTTTVTNPGHFGFEYTDDSATPATITAVTLEGADTVRIKLSSASVGANAQVRYAYTGTVGARAGATTGPRGNLRDSDASKSRLGNALQNWAVHFSMPVP